MMEFTHDFLSNKLFQDQCTSFDPLAVSFADGVEFQTGAFVQPNGDVLIRLYLPHASEVQMWIGVSRKVNTNITLHPAKDLPKGVFEGTVPYNPSMTGGTLVRVTVDGHYELMQDLPLIWTGNRPFNTFEIPDPEADYLMIHDVPHGTMTRNTFWANAMHNWEHCFVYTPPGYLKSGEEYPVLYLQHGGGDNETSWEYSGRVAHIMDNLIAEGKAVPFIIVMCNDQLRYGGAVMDHIDKAFERTLIDDVIHFIEANYRVRTDKWNRAVAGLSMGSFMTSDIGFGNPDVFGYVGNFTAGLTCGDLLDRYTYPRPHLAMLEKGAEEFAKNYRILFRSTTPQEDHLEFFEADDKLFEDAGIAALPCYHRKLYDPSTSKWNSWRLGLRDFAQLIFREP